MKSSKVQNMAYLGNCKWFRFGGRVEGENKWGKEKNLQIFWEEKWESKSGFHPNGDPRWPIKAARNCVPVIKLYGKTFLLLKTREDCIPLNQGLANYGFGPKLAHHTFLHNLKAKSSFYIFN